MFIQTSSRFRTNWAKIQTTNIHTYVYKTNKKADTHKQTNEQTHSYSQTDAHRQTDTHRQTNEQTHSHRQTDAQSQTDTHRQTDKLTNRQAQTNRQTDKQTRALFQRLHD